MYVCGPISGIYFPRETAVILIINLIGRIVYSIGYSSSKPKKRLHGVMIIFLVQVALITLTEIVLFNLILT